MKKKKANTASTYPFKAAGQQFIVSVSVTSEANQTILSFKVLRKDKTKEIELPEYALTWNSPMAADSKELAAIIKKGVRRLQLRVTTVNQRRPQASEPDTW